jgi:hypothetical protein
MEVEESEALHPLLLKAPVEGQEPFARIPRLQVAPQHAGVARSRLSNSFPMSICTGHLHCFEPPPEPHTALGAVGTEQIGNDVMAARDGISERLT